MKRKKMSRREFIKSSVISGLSLSVPFSLGRPKTALGATPAPKVVIISIDSLDPRYLDLTRDGEKGGCLGNYLMENVRAFLDTGAMFTNASCHMPSATDMNHLNALAGTCSRQTGIFGVSGQAMFWNGDGTMGELDHPNLFTWGRERPIDTLFSAWKREYGSNSATLYASGKEWVGNMFDVPGSGVDMILGGNTRWLDIPGRILPMVFETPGPYKFYDPPSDDNAADDPESLYQLFFSKTFYERNPENFPCDSWIVDNTLRIMKAASPDLSVMVLAQMDDLQHGLGTAYPEDFDRLLLSDRSSLNSSVIREPVLDAVRDVDIQFGRFINGMLAIPEYKDALFVLYSDHGHVTHRDSVRTNVGPLVETDPTAILSRRPIIGSPFLSDDEVNGYGYFAYTASSYGGLYFMDNDRQVRAGEAKKILDDYRLKDIAPDGSLLGLTSPWHIMTREDMINGITDQGILPDELYHPFIDRTENGLWPDVMIFMKDGWQLPITSGLTVNLGAALPEWLPPVTGFLGGHGSLDTRHIVLGFRGPGIPSGKIIDKPCKISDIALTLQSLLGMQEELMDKSMEADVAQDRSDDMTRV